MVRVLRSLRAMPLAAAMFASAWSAYGQDAEADKAASLLAKGLQQDSAMDFGAAKTTLLQVDRNGLSDAQRSQLDAKLRGLDTAIKAQQEAREAYLSGEKALKARDLGEARRQFRVAADSSYLPAVTREAAQGELGKIEARMSVLAAANADKRASGGASTASPRAADGPVLIAQADVKPVPKAPAAAKAAPATPTSEEFNSYMALGKSAMAERKGAEAEAYFLKALKYEPNNPQALLELDRARRLQETAGGEQTTGKLRSIREVARQAAVRDMEKALARSMETLAVAGGEGDFDKAADDARIALNTLGENKGYFESAEEYRAWERKINERVKYIQARKSDWSAAQANIALQRTIKAEMQRKLSEEKAKNDRLNDLTRQAKALLAESSYEGAANALTEILRLEPENRWAAYELDKAKLELEFRNQRRVQQDTNEQTGKSLRDIRESEIPWYMEIVYPQDWREKTIRRKAYLNKGSVEDAKSKATAQKLQSTMVKMEFEGQELGFIIDYLRETTDLPIHVKWRALEAVDINARTPVNIKLKNVTAAKALDILLGDLSTGDKKLAYTIDEGLVMISTGADMKGRLVQKTYDIRDMLVSVPSFIGPRIDISKLGSNQQSSSGNSGLFGGGAGGAGGAGGGGGGADTGSGGDVNPETKRPTAEEIKNQLKDTIMTAIDPGSWKGNKAGEPGEAPDPQFLHGKLIVTQTAANHEKLEKLLSELREALSLQVLVESRWLTVSNGWLERIGVDIDFTFGPDVHPFGRKIVFSNNQIQQSGSSWITGMTSGAATSIADNVPTAITMQGQFLDDVQVDFLIQATQATEDSRVLSAPRIMLMDGQRSYITIGRQQAYISMFNVTAEAGGAIGGAVAAVAPEVGWIPTGVVLDVEAVVSADRRYVTMTVRPQTSRLISLQTLSFGTLGGFIMLPNLELQDLQSSVTVPDGGTVLLGGLKNSAEQEREIGVPILSKVPVVNRLFDNRAIVRDASTLLILVSPKIIIHREIEDLRFPAPLQSALPGGGM